MKTYSIQDKYNNSKVWIIKVYDKGEVFYNQEIKGIKVNSRFQRTTKAWINEVLEMDLNERLSDEEQQELLDSEPPAEYMGQDGTLHTYDSIGDEYDENIHLDNALNEDLDPLPF